MAFADPQSVTIATVGTSLPNAGRAMDASAYQSDDGEVRLTISQSSSRRSRTTAKLQKSEVVADPLVPSTNQNVSYSAHIVIDRPKNGVSLADVGAIADALVLWATPANIVKMLGGQT